MEDSLTFEWSNLGNISMGRENLGENMPVFVYRLFEYTMRDAISIKYGNQASIETFREAGKIAGRSFFNRFLSDVTDAGAFIATLQKKLSEMKMGILRIESISEDGTIILTISEDLDCSGLPVSGETVCHYDEGFIAGILSSYYKREYMAEEIDCWAKGDRVCRFSANVKERV